MRRADSAETGNDQGSSSAPTGQPERGVGQADGKAFGRESELVAATGEGYAVRRGAGFGPERRDLPPLTNGQGKRINGEYCHHAVGYGDQSSALVRSRDMARRGDDFDPVQGAGQAGQGDAEEYSTECKNKQQLWEGEGAGHGRK